MQSVTHNHTPHCLEPWAYFRKCTDDVTLSLLKSRQQ